MSEIYSQWPSRVYALQSYLQDNETERMNLQSMLDQHFTKLFGYQAVTTSSGQSSLAIILNYYQANRSQIMYVPRWSSHCLWNVSGTYTDPTCISPNEADIILTVHKYGFVEKYNSIRNQIVIEDSCDSLLISNESCFSNGGEFEFISLPKIMGVYSGGVILCREPKHADFLRLVARNFGDYNEFAGMQRYNGFTGSGQSICDPEVHERRNYCPDLTVLKTISNNLTSFENNKNLILDRINYIDKFAPQLLASAGRLTPGRLPPVLPIPIKEEVSDRVVVRRVNISRNLNSPNYVPCALIPLHFGVKDDVFKFVVNCLIHNCSF